MFKISSSDIQPSIATFFMAMLLSMGFVNITDLPFLSVSIAGMIIGVSINTLNQSKIRSAVQVKEGAPEKTIKIPVFFKAKVYLMGKTISKHFLRKKVVFPPQILCSA
ncbi:hypothetical protein SAMN05421766_101460 [Zobellia uliginosa]|uniref:Uncharacterized protein n=1 Tax=Zobellia uliginosa TaxID=143224 RepID=A0ABY1KM51_9FLAO|nr:hypothetical protein [Zobellia uliginosa]SIS39552.1 hypothetical protein SAMN05421766_101460 [Zobellia uliginosa]